MSEARRSLTVLGCDGSYPAAGGAASGYLVRAGVTSVLLDAGPGTFANLQRLADPAQIDGVVLSHEHPDHWTDLESLAAWFLVTDRDRAAPVPVLAPPGLRQRTYVPDNDRFEWREVEPDATAQLGDLSFRFAATDHGPPTLAVRIESGDGEDALAYSADSGPDWTVASLGDRIGTFLCEATYTRQHEGSFRHLSGHQAGAMAADAQVGRLVLTHRWPTVSAQALRAEAEASFGRAVDQAAIGVTFEW